ncbi:zinc finger protein CONSTANS-LIKE 8 [Cynara cardunculus var. scolymus]|uniref:CCT domain-containing protein n=1 Tax=Cynara cardunculus var. scolymus TaxID=59895 RepID=A0A118JVP8_CYNCS|nr:zinc finger protein CONSTANS-LIKE 8 [Cynara cardunculus var. scolymus]KVH94091.1 CCT domain-containing protein [Cynara cardunculus var. scolymus]
MRQNFVLKSPKREEQTVPDSVIAEFFESNDDNLSDFKGTWGIKDGGNQTEGIVSSTYEEFDLDYLMEWDEFSIDEEDQGLTNDKSENREGNMVNLIGNIKREICGIWKEEEDEDQEDKEKNSCLNLNLNLNYQEVMDAWSNRGPCLTNDFTRSTSNDYYMGEVPVMEEARTKREASVLRYRKKRNNRLFSRKIRYQVRKLNADKRPRLKGRFVKRES